MRKRQTPTFWTRPHLTAIGMLLVLTGVWGWALTTTPPNIYTPVLPVPMRTSIGRPEVLRTTAPTPVARPTRVSTRRISSTETLCLAQALFFEASTEPQEGKEAIAAVVFNRMRSALYPATVCGVVYQAAQFSWTSDASKLAQAPPRHFIALAQRFLTNPDILINAYWKITHFHRTDIAPAWSDRLELAATYGHHKFYRF